MADRVLFLSWERPARDAEERSIDAFNETVGLLGRKQQEGRIEGFEVVMLFPNGELGGFMLVKGSSDQIHALREDEQFQRNVMKAQLAVDGIHLLDGVTGEGVARQMQMFQQAIGMVPQHA